RLTELEGSFEATERALDRLPELLAGGRFSESVADRLHERGSDELATIRSEIEQLHREDLDLDAQRALLYLRAFFEERSEYVEMFNRSQLGERAFRELVASPDAGIDAIRFRGATGGLEDRRLRRHAIEDAAVRALGRVRHFSRLVERLRMA